MAQIGNAANSKLNLEYAKHVRRFMKQQTAKKRRAVDKRIVRKSQNEARCVEGGIPAGS